MLEIEVAHFYGSLCNVQAMTRPGTYHTWQISGGLHQWHQTKLFLHCTSMTPGYI